MILRYLALGYLKNFDMTKPLISIITPFKNTSQFIAQCIESIQMQTEENWELLIVDDHSNDTSFEIVNEYAAKDSRIKILKNTKTGIISALQTGYNHSIGKLITRMDSDDIMPTEKLKSMSQELINHGRGYVSIGIVKYFSDSGISDGYHKYESWLNRLTLSGTNYNEIYKECVIASPCWMVFREDFDKCDGFNPNIYPEDYDLTFRFYKYNLKCIPSNNIRHYWRDYAIRTSRTHEHYAQNYFLDIKLKYFLELEHNTLKTLVLWGAGNKGKTIAKMLINMKINFKWICDNPKKIGKDIYGIKLKYYKDFKDYNSSQSIISLANTCDQHEISFFLKSKKLKSMTDYFFFC